MMTGNYTEYLRSRSIPEADIAAQMQAVGAFESWLQEKNVPIENAGQKEIRQYAVYLIDTGGNTVETYDALSLYAYWLGLRVLYVALVEVTDCHNGMEVLRDTIEARHGVETRDRIFTEPLPPLGADEAARLAHTKMINERMNELLSPKEVRAAWFQVQHGIPREFWEKHDGKQREIYAGCESLDVFLERMREDREAMLTRLHDENKLWFTQEITDDALKYLIGNRHMQLGEHNERKGIIITKVPYMADKVVHEKDPRRKRYYTCHCPLVREAILMGETLSDDVCYCSLGHASHFLSGIGLENLEGEVIESAVKGDARCRFIFYLPEERTAT